MRKNNKTITIILIIAAAIVWGTVVYKVFKWYQKSEKNIIVKTKPIKTEKIDINNYSLHIASRDPFLSIVSDTSFVPALEPEVQKPKTVVHKNLPIYCGVIISNKVKTGIFNCNKKYIFGAVGQKINDMKILSIHESKVVLLNDGEQVTIPVNNNSVR